MVVKTNTFGISTSFDNIECKHIPKNFNEGAHPLAEISYSFQLIYLASDHPKWLFNLLASC